MRRRISGHARRPRRFSAAPRLTRGPACVTPPRRGRRCSPPLRMQRPLPRPCSDGHTTTLTEPALCVSARFRRIVCPVPRRGIDRTAHSCGVTQSSSSARDSVADRSRRPHHRRDDPHSTRPYAPVRAAPLCHNLGSGTISRHGVRESRVRTIRDPHATAGVPLHQRASSRRDLEPLPPAGTYSGRACAPPTLTTSG